MDHFWLTFVPLFVAVDPIGLLPIFIGLAGHLDARRRRRVIVQSIITGSIVAMAFLLIGRHLLRVMGVTISDFLVAGGTLLFILALADLLSTDKQRGSMVTDHDTIGAVPLGVPLIVGPGVLATSLVLVDAHGMLFTGAALITNILLTGFILIGAPRILRLLGDAGSRVVSKLASLILAAFAIMFIRRGLMGMIPAAIEAVKITD